MTASGEQRGSAAHVLELVANGSATSRADLVRELGLAASTVSARVQELVEAGLLTESGEGASRGGRRPGCCASPTGARSPWPRTWAATTSVPGRSG
ncbi:helix-turn-helix domain-containing protein [Streptomyces lydicus]|nr:helix-turn-helix domain-containing protein [Streptomyces lydicus]